jgi:hypothetical protein
MKRNVGGKDRTARIVGGLALLGAATLLRKRPMWRNMLAAMGTNALATGSLAYCPASAAMGINTYRRTGLRRFLPV